MKNKTKPKVATEKMIAIAKINSFVIIIIIMIMVHLGVSQWIRPERNVQVANMLAFGLVMLST